MSRESSQNSEWRGQRLTENVFFINYNKLAIGKVIVMRQVCILPCKSVLLIFQGSASCYLGEINVLAVAFQCAGDAWQYSSLH